MFARQPARAYTSLNKDPNIARAANYGAHYLDKIIEQEKPDIYLAVQDIWGVDFAVLTSLGLIK